MNIILIGHSLFFLVRAVKELIKAKKENEKIVALCCNSSWFDQSQFDESKRDIKEVDWNFVADETELKEKLISLIEKEDCVIASELTLFCENEEQHKDYVSIKIIKEFIKNKKLKASRVTICSYHNSIKSSGLLFNKQIKGYLQETLFDSQEINHFYKVINSTKRPECLQGSECKRCSYLNFNDYTKPTRNDSYRRTEYPCICGVCGGEKKLIINDYVITCPGDDF